MIPGIAELLEISLLSKTASKATLTVTRSASSCKKWCLKILVAAFTVMLSDMKELCELQTSHSMYVESSHRVRCLRQSTMSRHCQLSGRSHLYAMLCYFNVRFSIQMCLIFEHV